MIHEKTAHSGKKRPDLYETVLKEKEADMETEVLKEQHYVEELVDIIRSGTDRPVIRLS